MAFDIRPHIRFHCILGHYQAPTSSVAAKVFRFPVCGWMAPLFSCSIAETLTTGRQVL